MTKQMTTEQAWRKAREYEIAVEYGPRRKISCDFEEWKIGAVIRTDEDLPELIAEIERRSWPERCRVRAWT